MNDFCFICSVLALHELTEKADCVLPVENQALLDLCQKVVKASQHKAGQAAKPGSAVTAGKGGIATKEKPFDTMNNIVANLMLNLTR